MRLKKGLASRCWENLVMSSCCKWVSLNFGGRNLLGATVVIGYHLVEEIWYGATVINGTVVNTTSWWIKSGKELLWNY